MSDLHHLFDELISDTVDVAWAAGPIGSAAANLFEIEAAVVDGAAAKRRREFAAGRAFARAALARLGGPAGAIPVGAGRQPVWPAGWRGSIAHSAYLCAAVVARAGAYGAVGVDLEPDAPLAARLVDGICRPDERAALATQPRSPIDLPKLVFVVKEAVFKAQYPRSDSFLAFRDVRVVLDLERRAFRAEVLRPGAPRTHFGGRFGAADGHLLAVTLTPAGARGS